jgi:hypothetical protein
MEPYIRNRRCLCMRCISHDLMGSAVLITIGVLFLIDKLGGPGFNHTFPIMLIVIGLVMIARMNAPITGHVQPTLPQVPAQPRQEIPNV